MIQKKPTAAKKVRSRLIIIKSAYFVQQVLIKSVVVGLVFFDESYRRSRVAVERTCQHIGYVVAPYRAFLALFSDVLFDEFQRRVKLVIRVSEEAEHLLHKAVSRASAHAAHSSVGKACAVCNALYRICES